MHAGKSARNAALAQAELDALLTGGAADPRRVAGVLLDQGRTLLGLGRRQEAVDAFEAVRDLAPATRERAVATDFLARLLLAAEGYDDVVLVLVDELRAAGADAAYCDWLAAPALTHLGRAAEALPGLRGVRALVDPGGRVYDVGQVHELRSLVAAVVGEREEAVEALAVAMTAYGRVRGRGSLLLDLADGRVEELTACLADGLAAGGGAYVEDVLAELDGLDESGRAVAAALRRRLGGGDPVPLSPARRLDEARRGVRAERYWW